MGPLIAVIIAIQSLVFIAWAIMMFRMLLILRKRDVDTTGGPFPSTGGFIAQMKYWLNSDEDRRDRLILIALTAALFALNIVNIVSTR